MRIAALASLEKIFAKQTTYYIRRIKDKIYLLLMVNIQYCMCKNHLMYKNHLLTKIRLSYVCWVTVTDFQAHHGTIIKSSRAETLSNKKPMLSVDNMGNY